MHVPVGEDRDKAGIALPFVCCCHFSSLLNSCYNDFWTDLNKPLLFQESFSLQLSSSFFLWHHVSCFKLPYMFLMCLFLFRFSPHFCVAKSTLCQQIKSFISVLFISHPLWRKNAWLDSPYWNKYQLQSSCIILPSNFLILVR